ncbi:hypothetical protein [Streptomyces canus]|uniref:hypothetical protein n=1 Tax=Streptomyces canus TaxID=58343 RepID=UPI0032442D7F
MAYLSFRGGSRTDREVHHQALMILSAYCGHVRGIADAARRDCKQTVKKLKRGAGRFDWMASETRGFFDDEVRQVEQPPNSLEEVLAYYQRAVDTFGASLDLACTEIDQVDRPLPGEGRRRSRRLKDIRKGHLRTLRELLKQLDVQFGFCQEMYLNRFLGSGVERERAKRRSRRQFKLHRRRASKVRCVHPRRPIEPVSSPLPGAARTADARADETPPCGYCIWRCPHAPAQCDGQGRGGQSASTRAETSDEDGSAGDLGEQTRRALPPGAA